MILGPLDYGSKTAVGSRVTVWFGDQPAKLSGEVVKVVVPGDALRVKITSRGEDLPAPDNPDSNELEEDCP